MGSTPIRFRQETHGQARPATAPSPVDFAPAAAHPRRDHGGRRRPRRRLFRLPGRREPPPRPHAPPGEPPPPPRGPPPPALQPPPPDPRPPPARPHPAGRAH